ncbi:hypothetical protein D9758_003716 [Tetrapyrgos nigripes]|uniref:Uncharacterized protein n=1 Tax=Tetrapyrgos nigripes TaxID=182062 RepID=A0A8H5LRQ4_9AGAR|nr:hypothetical protein D9758_003716 [Tetrapyrgos nigripes]
MDDNGADVCVDEEDEGPLFGSPPPSPVRGRSPSPGLALPSSNSAAEGVKANTQNVGIIALPGSQHCSELPINPLALSMSYKSQGNGSAQPTGICRSGPGGAVAPSASTPALSRASSRSSSRAPSAPPIRKTKAMSRTSSPRPPPLQITLPDPSEPLPPNWLRSQSALLGYAGVVGGVNTTTLSLRHAQGTSSSNPIVIEDDKVEKPRPPPRLAPQLPLPSTKEIVQILIKQKEVFPILQDILRLQKTQPPPPSRENSFVTPSLSLPKDDEPPKKKRKMDGVPAGAADWDIPFPFSQGDAPREYYLNWAQDRQKQLIGQLVSLIKAATRKAALRKRLREQEEEKRRLKGMDDLQQKRRLKIMDHSQPKILTHYRPPTVRYGEGNEQVLADASNEPMTTPPTPPSKVDSSSTLGTSSTSATAPSETPSFDQLISDLLATVPDDTQSDATDAHNSMEMASVASTSSHDPTPELDDGFMNLWSSMSDFLPMDNSFAFMGDSIFDQDPSLQSGLPSSAPSFLEPLPVQSSDLTTSGTLQSELFSQQSIFDQSTSASTAGTMSSSEHQLSQLLPSNSTSNDITASALDLLFFHQGAQAQLHDSSAPYATGFNAVSDPVSDAMIDPELLALSRPVLSLPVQPPSNPQTFPYLANDIQSPSTCGSPMPSMSSSSSTMGSAGELSDLPMTPRSAVGDVMFPTIANSIPNSDMNEGSDSGSGSGKDLGTMGKTSSVAIVRREGSMVDNAQGEAAANKGKEKGKEKEKEKEQDFDSDRDVDTHTAMNEILPALLSKVMSKPFGLNGPRGHGGKKASSTRKNTKNKKIDKKELLKSARERRRLLAEELIKTRMQLWETTIEHGVLMNIAKYSTFSSNPTQ